VADQCSGCKYYNPIYRQGEKETYCGECRCSDPAPAVQGKSSYWPVCEATACCGEFVAKS